MHGCPKEGSCMYHHHHLEAAYEISPFNSSVLFNDIYFLLSGLLNSHAIHQLWQSEVAYFWSLLRAFPFFIFNLIISALVLPSHR